MGVAHVAIHRWNIKYLPAPTFFFVIVISVFNLNKIQSYLLHYRETKTISFLCRSKQHFPENETV